MQIKQLLPQGAVTPVSKWVMSESPGMQRGVRTVAGSGVARAGHGVWGGGKRAAVTPRGAALMPAGAVRGYRQTQLGA